MVLVFFWRAKIFFCLCFLIGPAGSRARTIFRPVKATSPTTDRTWRLTGSGFTWLAIIKDRNPGWAIVRHAGAAVRPEGMKSQL